jgi:thiamine biosynthesis lipoprotein
MEKPNPQPSRRELLAAKLPNGQPQDDSLTVVDYGPLFHFSSNAMGCKFQVLCDADGRKSLAGCVAEGFDLIHFLEQQLSIYRPSSQLSLVNRQAFEKPVTVDRDVFELLELAREISQFTGGTFDITATPLTRLWKTHRNERSIPSDLELQEAMESVGYVDLTLDREQHSVRFQKKGMVLDLGGIGKGFALDQLKSHLQAAQCTDFLIHGGQSSVLSGGERADRSGQNKFAWQVSISHPLKTQTKLATISLKEKAIGTSGSARQNYVVNGKRLGHIIDPRTGWPSNGLLSVTVLAPTAVLADALATAIFVAGPEQASQICKHFQVGAILISEAGKIIDILEVDETEIQLH